MIIVVDLAGSTISLDEPDVLDAFSVRLDGKAREAAEGATAAAIGALLDDLGAGRPADEADHVWVDIDTVRLLAEDQVDETWAAKFDGVIAYATTKGWVDDDGTSIKAHLEP